MRTGSEAHATFLEMKHRILEGFDANGVLAGSGYASRPDRFARDPSSKLSGLDGLGDHTASPDDRLVSNVCHDDASGSNPTVPTDHDLLRLFRLVANRNIQAIE